MSESTEEKHKAITKTHKNRNTFPPYKNISNAGVESVSTHLEK